MRKATQKEMDKFLRYRSLHVALVQRIGKVVFNEDFEQHDKDKIECNGEELNNWAVYNAYNNGEYSNPTSEELIDFKKIKRAHLKKSKHHPEYWDSDFNPSAYNTKDIKDIPVKASLMSKKALCEMCCDWSAVAIYLNKPIFEWYNKTCNGDNPKFIFTEKQKEYIRECLTKIYNSVEKENLKFPDRKYDIREDDKPIIEDIIIVKEKCLDLIKSFSEKIVKYGDKWRVVDHTGKKNLGTYDTKEQAEERLKQVEMFKHMNEKDDLLREEEGSGVSVSGDGGDASNSVGDTIINSTPENVRKIISLGSLNPSLKESFYLVDYMGQKVYGSNTPSKEVIVKMKNDLEKEKGVKFTIQYIADGNNIFKSSKKTEKVMSFVTESLDIPNKETYNRVKELSESKYGDKYLFVCHPNNGILSESTRLAFLKSIVENIDKSIQVVELKESFADEVENRDYSYAINLNKNYDDSLQEKMVESIYKKDYALFKECSPLLDNNILKDVFNEISSIK